MGQRTSQLVWAHLLIFILLLCSGTSFALNPLGSNSNEEEFLTVDEAFQLTATANGSNEVKLFWNIADGYYLYKKRISVNSDDANVIVGELQLPTGKQQHDEFFGDVEIYEHSLDLAVPVSTPSDTINLIVGYQGCAHAGLCYPPTKKTVTVNLLQGNEANNSNASSTNPTQDVNQPDSILGDLKNASPLYAILLSLGFGILVAFTACMYPMIPILTSLIMGQGEKITTFRAFSLSLSYTQGIAITFGVLGAIMAVVVPRDMPSGDLVQLDPIRIIPERVVAPDAFELRTSGGMTLSVPAGFDEIELRRLLDVLAEC